MPAPVFNLRIPVPEVTVSPTFNMAAPEVTVEKAAGPQEVSIVSMPDRVGKTRATVKRDAQGIRETETQTVEADA